MQHRDARHPKGKRVGPRRAWLDARLHGIVAYRVGQMPGKRFDGKKLRKP